MEIDPANGIFDSGVGGQPSFLELFAGTASTTRLRGAPLSVTDSPIFAQNVASS